MRKNIQEILFWVNYLAFILAGLIFILYKYQIMAIICFGIASTSCLIKLIESMVNKKDAIGRTDEK